MKVVIHFERIPGTGKPAWWAESPDVPGFSAAAPTLTELRVTTERAVREIAEAEGMDPLGFSIDWHFAAESETDGDAVVHQRDAAAPWNEGTAGAERVTERVLQSA